MNTRRQLCFDITQICVERRLFIPAPDDPARAPDGRGIHNMPNTITPALSKKQSDYFQQQRGYVLP